MNQSEKTHYRKAFDSPYLSSDDIVEPTVLTVKYVALESDHTKKTKDQFNTAHFLEKEIRPGEKLKALKPWIHSTPNLNAVIDVEVIYKYDLDKLIAEHGKGDAS